MLVACGDPTQRGDNSQAPEPVDARVFVDQATLPDEAGYEFAAVAPDAREMARQWQRFGLSGEPPTVDFDTEVALFVGFGESGSCPYEHGGVAIDIAENLVSFIDAADHPNICTGDYNPRTLGLSFDRSVLPNGVFRVLPPNGAAVTVAAEPVQSPPQESPGPGR